MKYSKPELVVLGPASLVIMGGPRGTGDSTNGDVEKVFPGVLPGLDD
jgi:hypothetical protein